MPTSNKNLALPANSSTGWDVPLNSNASEIDTALGGTQTINVTGNATTPIVLTPTFPIVSTPITSMSYIPSRIALTGNLSQATAIKVPTGVGGIWDVANYTNGAYAVTFGVVGSANTITIPLGVEALVCSDGLNPYPVGGAPSATFVAGDYKFSASSAAQSGWLLCYGQAISRTTYSALYAAIGTTYGAGDGSTTFNLPDCRGRVLAGADNMGGVAAGRLTGYTIAVAGGEQTHTLATTEMPSHNHTASDAGHTHVASDAGHTHPILISGAHLSVTGGAGINLTEYASGTTGLGYANVTVYTGYASVSIGYTGSSGAHNNVQPTMAGYLFIYTGQ